MGEKELTAGPHGSLNGAPAGIKRHHDLPGRSGGVSHLESRVVPFFREAKRGYYVNDSNYILRAGSIITRKRKECNLSRAT